MSDHKANVKTFFFKASSSKTAKSTTTNNASGALLCLLRVLRITLAHLSFYSLDVYRYVVIKKIVHFSFFEIMNRICCCFACFYSEFGSFWLCLCTTILAAS